MKLKQAIAESVTNGTHFIVTGNPGLLALNTGNGKETIFEKSTTKREIDIMLDLEVLKTKTIYGVLTDVKQFFINYYRH